MKQLLDGSNAASFGLLPPEHEEMPNGETRDRLMGVGGYGYILTRAGATGAWQNAHLHQVRETYIVQHGWMVLVDWHDGVARWRLFNQGDVVTTEPGVAHNIYLVTGAVIHTVKHGNTVGKDWWYPAPELDAVTKSVTDEHDIRERALPTVVPS